MGANLHPDEYGLTNTLTQLSLPHSVFEYFNTRISPLSPYNKYDLSGQLVENGPDNRMRWGQWPIILIRSLAEMTGNTGYDELRMTGRYLSAILDVITLLIIFLIGKRLYGSLIGLLAAALSSLTVLQIQQSHFMTVDNFVTFFATLTMYAGVRIAQIPPVFRKPAGEFENYAPYQFKWAALKWYLFFGISLGMAVASKVNIIPLAGMALVASFMSIADLKLKTTPDIKRIFSTAVLLVGVAGLSALITFRMVQPMSFRAPTGNTSLLTTHLNQDWVDSMKVAREESAGIGGGPPAEQWADRDIIVFPLMNMVVWGMGLPLGIAAWYGWGKAGWSILRGSSDWRAHVLPVIWAGGFFLFIATRWVKSIRYFLPVYPFLCLLAAWGVIQLFNNAKRPNGSANINDHIRIPARRYIFPILFLMLVTGGTLIWAASFTRAVYVRPNTRIQATRWIFDHIPAPIHIQLTTAEELEFLPVSVPDGQVVNSRIPYQQSMRVNSTGKLASVILPHVRNDANEPIELMLTISQDADGAEVIDQVSLLVSPSKNERGDELEGKFSGGEILAEQDYYLTASTKSVHGLIIYRNTVASEDWDEGLPVRLDGYDPYGQFYRGITMPVRWTDDENKRQAFLENLQQVDYVTLSSQRSIWSICRLPQMYPMTIEYYRALFDGRLGFDLVAEFRSPLKIGPLEISDAGGTVAWNQPPALPLFNFNLFAAEEAFTVYDHPPVWIFKKTANYSDNASLALLGSIDLSRVVFQSPYEAKVVPIQ